MFFTDADKALRAALYVRFAVLDEYVPVRCTTHRHQKIVYATREQALGCARELVRLDPDGPRHAHPCGTHWHLTRMETEGKGWTITI